MSIEHKIDFTVFFSVINANPNGDPLNGNRPRQNFDGYGEVSDVAIKRKIRNRLQDAGEHIFVQSNDRADDGKGSLKARADSVDQLKEIIGKKKTTLADADTYAKLACEQWIDTRAFGQVFAFKGASLSVGVRGPVSIQQAISIEPISINSIQITKSVNSEDAEGRASDTMGMKHFVDFGIYRFNGSINVQLAEKTGFSEEDAQKIKDALSTLFENDASSARPDGSMVVERVYWWEHSSKLGQYSSAKVFRSISISRNDGVTNPHSFDDYKISQAELEGLHCEVINPA